MIFLKPQHKFKLTVNERSQATTKTHTHTKTNSSEQKNKEKQEDICWQYNNVECCINQAKF